MRFLKTTCLCCLISTFCLSACDGQNAVSGSSGVIAASNEPKSPALPASDSQPAVSPGLRAFLVRLPEGVLPHEVTGIKVELQMGKIVDRESFVLAFKKADAQGAVSEKSELLGLSSVFQVPKTDERFTLYLEPPAARLWNKDGKGWSMNVLPQLLAAHPQRRVPDISLTVTSASAETGK